MVEVAKDFKGGNQTRLHIFWSFRGSNKILQYFELIPESWKIVQITIDMIQNHEKSLIVPCGFLTLKITILPLGTVH